MEIRELSKEGAKEVTKGRFCKKMVTVSTEYMGFGWAFHEVMLDIEKIRY